MKKTGLYVVLVLGIPLGIVGNRTHSLGICLIIGALMGWAAAIYDMREPRG